MEYCKLKLQDFILIISIDSRALNESVVQYLLFSSILEEIKIDSEIRQWLGPFLELTVISVILAIKLLLVMMEVTPYSGLWCTLLDAISFF